MRPGQHNNKRGRGRNRGRHSGGGGGGNNNGGGNPANRVFDSNGPDVKLRGTAQTIAEKYMQLGRDAQSSGDIVMAESYFQHSEHYYRLWLANQPAGQPIQFARRNDEEEFEEEGSADNAEHDDDNQSAEGGLPDGGEGGSSDEGSEGLPVGADQGQGGQNGRPMRQQREYRDNNREGRDTYQRDSQPRDNQPRDNQPRDFQPRDNQPRDNQPRDAQPRDGGQQREGGRERFKPRWPRRGERPVEGAREGGFNGRDAAGATDSPERVQEAQPQVEAEDTAGNWEAPSFLTRPVPPVVTEEAVAEEAPAAAPERRPRREAKPRRPREEAAPIAADVAPPDTTE